MGQIIDKTINQPPFGPKCEDDCEAKPYDKKGKTCYKGECINVCPANAYIRKDGKCACEDGYKYLDQQLPGQDKLKGDGWGHCKEEKTKDKTEVKKKVKGDKKVKSGKRLGGDLEKKSQEDNKLLDFLEEQLKKNPNLTEDDLYKLFNPEKQEPIVRTIIERPDPIIKTVVQTVIKTPEPVVSNCVYGNLGRHSQINDSCPGKEGPNKNIRWDTIKKKWFDIENETYVEKDFVKEMRVPTVIPPMNGGTCYEDGKKDKIEPCRIDGVERSIDGVWGSWKEDRIDGNITTIDTVNSNWSNEVNGEQQNINFGKEGQECITEESLLKGNNPIQVFKREPTIVPKYGGKRLEGPSVRRKPYMYDENKMEYTTYCPINATFTKDWKNIDWNEEKCSEGYTQKQLLNESTKKFERDSNLPGYIEEERKDEDRIIGPGDRTIYRYKTRKVKRNSKHGGIPVGKWYSSTGDVSREKYDYRLKGYDECPGVREAIEKIKSNDTEWKNLNLVAIEPKDCKPVFTWNKKWYKPFEKDSNDAIIDTTSIREIKVRPGIGNEQARGLDGVNDPKQVLNYALNTVKKRGKFIFSSVKHSNATINSDGSWEPTQNRKGEWIQMETDDGNIQVITGVITQGDHVKNSWVKKFEVKVSRNGQSWSTLIKNNEGKTEFNGNTDKSTEKDNKFKTPIEARYIRIYPTEWNNTISMRTGYIKKGDNSVTCYGGSGLLGDSKPEALLVFDKQATMDKGYYHQGSGVECPSDGEKFVYNGRFSNFSKYKESNINIKDGDSIVKAYKILDKNPLNQCGIDETHGGWSSPWSKCLKPLESGLAPNKNKDTGEYDKEQLATCIEENGYQYKYRKWNSDAKGDGFRNKKDDKTYKDSTEPYAGDFSIIRKSCERENKCVLIPELDNKLILKSKEIIVDDYKGSILNIVHSGELIEPAKFKDNVYKINMQGGIKHGEEYALETFFNYELVDKANEVFGEDYDIEDWTINNYEIRMIEGPNNDTRIDNQQEQKKRGIHGSSGWNSHPIFKRDKPYKDNQIKRFEVPDDYDFVNGTFCEDMGYINTQNQDVSLYPYSTSGHFLHTGLIKDDPKKFSELNTLNGRISEKNYLQEHEIEKRFEKEKDGIITKNSGTPSKNMTEAECKAYGESIGQWGGVVTLSNEIKGCYYLTGNLSPKVWYNNDSTSVADCSLAERACIEKNEDLRKKIEEEEKKKKFIMCTWGSFFNSAVEIPEENIAKFRLDTHDIVNKYKEQFASINIENNSREKPKKYKKEPFTNITRSLFGKTEHFGKPKPKLCINTSEEDYWLDNGRSSPKWVTKCYSNGGCYRFQQTKSISEKVSCKKLGRFKKSNAKRICDKGVCSTTWCCEEPGGSDPQASSCKDYECSKGFSKKLSNTCTKKRQDRHHTTEYKKWTKCTPNYKSCKGQKCTDNECCEKPKFYSEPKQKNINSICLPGYDCEVIPVGILIQKHINSSDSVKYEEWHQKQIKELKEYLE